MADRGISSIKVAAGVLVFAFCCLVDLAVVRSAWMGRQIVEGQFRRGYFEKLDGEVGLAVDNAIRPIFPSSVLTSSGALAVPPGMSAVVPLGPGADYDVVTDSALAPYVVVASEAPVTPIALDGRPSSGEARLVGGRTLSLRDGRLALVAWNANRPWHEDEARLSSLRAACVDRDRVGATLRVHASQGELRVDFGRCTLHEPLPRSAASAQLAALAGPDWITLVRRPAWIGESWITWPVVAIVIGKVALTAWGAGLVSAAALSATLGVAAPFTPVLATLTWPLTLLIGVAAAAVRAAVLILRRIPRRWRLPAVAAVVVLLGAFVASRPSQPRQFPPVIRRDESRGDPTCALVGYSTAGGAGLRGGHGGASVFLDEQCGPCRLRSGQLSGGGETLAWARDAYCASEASFGTNGHVIFFGAANDDFLWGLTSMARMFIVGEQGIEPWRRNQAPAAAASLARIDSQTSALQGLMQCARNRQAKFLFLHDFLVSDIVSGRDADRAAMLARRRATVDQSGGLFVDLLDVFGAEAGVAWFNDYVHLSAIAHERVAELACRRLP